MATFYVGYRNVLKGRSSGDFVHHYNGRVGEYSHFALMSASSVLDGAPDNPVVKGAERRYSFMGLLEYIYTGRPHNAPMKDPKDGSGYEGGRFRPLEFKGLTGAFSGENWGFFGPATESARHSNYIFEGIQTAQALLNPGAPRRFDSPWGGAFNPWVRNGVGESAMAGAGQPAPADHTSPYGKNRINEWRGVSAAL